MIIPGGTTREKPPQLPAFTLIEMLVSMALLVVLIVMVAQLLQGATIATTQSRKRLDADAQARVIFDRMADDFARMILRKDVDYQINHQPDNDCIFFFSEAPGYFSSATNQSPVSLVGYRIHSNPDPEAPSKSIPQFERLGKGLTWDGVSSVSSPGSPVFLTDSATDGTLIGSWPTVVTDTSTDEDFQVFGEQVFRLEIAFVLRDGSVSNKPVASPHQESSYAPTANDAAPSYNVGSRWFDTTHDQGYICANITPGAAIWRRIGLQDVSAIVVAIAILDSSTQNLVADRSKMAASFPDPTDQDLQADPPKLMAGTWFEILNAGGFAVTAGIPQAAAAQVRVYQRIFYLNQN